MEIPFQTDITVVNSVGVCLKNQEKTKTTTKKVNAKMKKNKDFIEYLQEQGIVLTERGNRWWASCPFHPDSNPSFTVSRKEGGYVWYCYSCKKGGSPVDFISEFKQIPKFEARRVWADLCGIKLNTEREAITKLFDDLPYHQYLKDRGITEETARRFHVGYVSDYGDWISRVGLDRTQARELGILECDNAIVYPFYDEDGIYKMAFRPVDHKEYKTSPETSKFFKRGMWGWQTVRRKDELYIFEGYHDAMVAVQAGYNAICACGTEIHEDGWMEVDRFGIEKIIVCPDGDLGGQGWLDRIVRKCPQDLSLEVIALKSGDPDDCILAGQFDKQKRWNPFEWYLTAKYGSVADLASKCSMLKESADVYNRMSDTDKVLAREWYAKTYGSDEALINLKVDERHDVNAERTVLANCLCSTNARLDTIREIKPEYFTGEFFQSIFQYIVLHEQVSFQIILTTFHVDLSDSADLVNYSKFIEIVRKNGESNVVRRLLKTCDPSNIPKIVEDLFKISDNIQVKSGEELVRNTMKAINQRIQDPKAQGVEIKNFPTLNHTLLGWNPDNLILLSGNSGHGKTTVACNFINNLVDDYRCLFFSLEMTEEKIMEKILTIRSGVPSSKIMTGSLEQFEYDKLVEASQSLMHGNLQIITGDRDLYKIVAVAKALILRRKIRFVFIDYIQLITMKSHADRWEQLAEITKTLKNQICSLGVTVVGLSQLKKQALQSDIPDANEQAGAYGMVADADVAMAVRKQDPEEHDGSNFLINVSKNRYGWDEVQIPCDFDRTIQVIKEINAN